MVRIPFSALVVAAASAAPQDWSVILDAPSKWASPLSQAAASRDLAPVFVSERPWRLRLRVRALVERYAGRHPKEILERSGVTRLVVIAAGLGDDLATALWKTAKAADAFASAIVDPRTTLVIASPDREASALSAAFNGFARALADASARATVVVGPPAVAPSRADEATALALFDAQPGARRAGGLWGVLRLLFDLGFLLAAACALHAALEKAAAFRTQLSKLRADLAKERQRAEAAEAQRDRDRVGLPMAKPLNAAVLETLKPRVDFVTASVSADEADEADSGDSASDTDDDDDAELHFADSGDEADSGDDDDDDFRDRGDDDREDDAPTSAE